MRRSTDRARSTLPFPVLRQRLPGLVGAGHQRVVPGGAEAINPYVDQVGQIARQVLDVHACPSVHIRGVLPGEKGDTAHTTTFSPLPMTTTPRAEMVKWLASSSGSVPTCTPGATVTFLSMMARRTTAPSPMRTLSMITESSTSAPLFDLHAGRDDRAPHRTPGNYGPGGHDRIERLPGAAGLLEDKLGGRQLSGAGEDGPVQVVKVERRLHRHQVHAGVVVAVKGADVSPVTTFGRGTTAYFVGVEIVKVGVAAVNKAGDDVAAHVVTAVGVLGILTQGVHQSSGVEDVIAHRGMKVRPARGQCQRFLRLFDKTVDKRAPAGLDDPETLGFGGRHGNGRHGRHGPALDVLGQHLARVHPVNMVGSEDQDVVGTFITHNVQVLVNGVGRAGEPPRPRRIWAGTVVT